MTCFFYQQVSYRWTKMELALFIKAVSKHGTDFAAIARTLGSKTESYIRDFNRQFGEKLGLHRITGNVDLLQFKAADPLECSVTSNNQFIKSNILVKYNSNVGRLKTMYNVTWRSMGVKGWRGIGKTMQSLFSFSIGSLFHREGCSPPEQTKAVVAQLVIVSCSSGALKNSACGKSRRPWNIKDNFGVNSVQFTLNVPQFFQFMLLYLSIISLLWSKI